MRSYLPAQLTKTRPNKTPKNPLSIGARQDEGSDLSSARGDALASRSKPTSTPTYLGAEQKGPPQRRTPADLGRTLQAQSLQNEPRRSQGKRKVYEAALAEPEPVHFPPLKLSPARSTNPDPEQASTNGGKLRRRRAGSTKATELKRTLSKVRGAVAPWGRSLTFAPNYRNPTSAPSDNLPTLL